MNWFRRESADRFVEALVQAASGDPPSSSRAAATLLDDLLLLLERPAPPESLVPLFAETPVLVELASRTLHAHCGEEARSALHTLHPLSRRFTHREPRVSIRRLGPDGYYSNRPFASRGSGLAIRDNVPYLVTRRSPREDSLWSYGSELNRWNRHEVRIAMAMAMVKRFHGAPEFTSDVTEFPESFVQNEPLARRLDFAAAYRALASGAPTQVAAEVSGGGAWLDFRLIEKDVRRFASKFLVSHPVLLRTSVLYLKARMLWTAEEFQEEALANLCFALEGALLLLQEVYGGDSLASNRKLQDEIFDDLFDHGAAGMNAVLYSLRGRGQHRASLVHPELAHENGWVPMLSADDFLETITLFKSFMWIALFGESLEDWPLNTGA